MRKLCQILFVLLICFVNNIAFGQQSLNLDFEKLTPKNQPAYWWALGDGYMASSDSVIFFKGHRSIKLSCIMKTASKRDFGRLTIELPHNIFDGKSSMIFSGWIKTNNVTGNAKIGCWLFDKNMKIIESIESDKDSITATTEWKKISIQAKINDKTKYLYIDATLNGTGTAWFDNFEIFIDGEKIDF